MVDLAATRVKGRNSDFKNRVLEPPNLCDRPTSYLCWGRRLGKHKHVPAIERALPMERIVEVFEARFGDPYLDPTAELTFEELTSAFPDVPVAELEEGLLHWTSHSAERTLSTKTVETDA